MLKKGFKKLMISFGLVLLSSVCFIGCGDTEKVSVTSVKFLETEKIVMLVDQTYTPQISVAPSFADNKDFYFEISINSDVIKIENNSIKALKEGVAQLKVVSDDNSKINDIISVKVMPEPIDLTAPTDLSFNGDYFTFTPVDDANAYILNINNTDIELGNTCSYAINDFAILKNSSIYDLRLNAKVKALGDSRYTNPSQFSSSVSYLKSSDPKNVVFDNGKITFDAVPNVDEYRIKVFKNNELVTTISANANNGKVITFLQMHITNFIPGDYKCEIICGENDFSASTEVSVINPKSVILDYNVLPSPQNIRIIQPKLYWDNVLYATSYSLVDGERVDSITNKPVVIKDDITTNEFDFSTLNLTTGTHNFKLVANSTLNNSVMAGINYSSNISFSILDKPVASAEDRELNWTSVPNATSYILEFFDSESTSVKKANVVTTSYSLSSFGVGTFTYNIKACGNGETYLNSKEIETGSFTILAPVTNLAINLVGNDRIVSWDCEQDECSFDFQIVNAQSELQENLETPNKSKIISGRDYAPGNYIVKVSCLGTGNTFDSSVASLTFTQLEEIDSLDFNDNTLTFEIDPKTVFTEVICYNATDVNDLYEVTKVSNNEYTVNNSDFSAGNYIFRVFAYGNDKNIFSAKNLDTNTDLKLNITKLGAPEIVIDGTQLKINTTIVGATSYKLFENGVVKSSMALGQPLYELNGLSTGEYAYTIQSIGNGKELIDSEIGASELKVLKLSTPTLEFDKANNQFNISTSQDDFIDDYTFSLNGSAVAVINKTASVSSLLTMAGEYTAVTQLLPKLDGSTIYDLILQSEETSLIVNKINSESELSISNGKIVIKPNAIITAENGYSVVLKIGYKEEHDAEYTYVDYNSLVRENDAYTVQIMDNDFNAVGPTKAGGDKIFTNPGNYDLKVSYSNSNNEIIDSIVYSLGTISKLDKVSSINRNNENILFSEVDNATKYQIQFQQPNNCNFEITTTEISMLDLKTKCVENNLNLLDGNTYAFKIIALGSDQSLTLSTISDISYTFGLLNKPTISYGTDEVGKKITIINNVPNVEYYYAVFTDSDNNIDTKIITPTNSEEVIYLNNVFGLITGNIDVKVYASSNAGNYYNSGNSELSYTQLDSPVVDINNGVISWEIDTNAESYRLYYYTGVWQVIKLTTTNSNYSILGSQATYNFTELNSGLTQIKLKAVSKLKNETTNYFDSPESASITNVLKLSKISASIDGALNLGNITINVVETDIPYIDRIEVTRDGRSFDLDSLVDEIESTMVINADEMLTYLPIDAINSEHFNFVVYAKNYEEGVVDKHSLKSNVYACSFKGLKPIDSLEIQMTTNYQTQEPDSLDKIVWTNNPVNATHIYGYDVVIDYGDDKYSTIVEGENVNYLTFPNTIPISNTYKVKIKVLAKAGSGYANSPYSNEYLVTRCEKPTEIRTEDGILKWKEIVSAGQYLVRVYNADGTNLLTCNKVLTNNFDFTNYIGDAELYSVKIQAINENDNTIISSDNSDAISILRLPKITKYKLDMGVLKIFAHTFTSKVKLVLSSTDTEDRYVFTSTINTSVESLKDDYSKWTDVDNIDTLITNEDMETYSHGLMYHTFEVNISQSEKTTILDCLNLGYTLELQAIGNTRVTTDTAFATVNSSISGSADLTNTNTTNTNIVTKILTPTVLNDARGILHWDLENTTYTGLNYKDLLELLLYEVSISTQTNDYAFYVIDYLDIQNLPSMLDESDIYIYQSIERHTYYGYFKYDDMYINILRYKNDTHDYLGDYIIDFTLDELCYVGKTSAELQFINFVTGGNFDISINVVGDDTIYLTSDKSNTINIVRYVQLQPSFDDGKIKWLNLYSTGDSPIYLLKIEDTEEPFNTFYIYVYDETLPYSLTIENAPIYVDNFTFAQGIDMSGEYINYILDAINSDNDYVINKGSYNVTITTYHRDNNNNLSIINSMESLNNRVNKLKEATLGINNGSLTWEQISYVNTLQQKEYIYNYQITVNDGDEHIYRITNADYTIDYSTHQITYSIPKSVTCENGETYEFTEGTNYTISIRTLAGSLNHYINSNSSNIISTNMANSITNLGMRNEKLEWESEYVDGLYQVKLTYLIGTTTISYMTTTANKYYILPSEITDTSGQNRILTSEYAYNISVRKLGNNTIFSSFYSEPVVCEILKTVNISSVKTVGGVAVWDGVTNLAEENIEGVNYEFTLPVPQTNINECSYDFAGKSAGELSFTIISHHDNYFPSYATANVTLYKFGIIENLIRSDENLDGIYNELKWEPVNVNGVYADAYKIDINGEEYIYQPASISETIIYTLPTVDTNDLIVKVKAITLLDENNIVNGEWCGDTSFTKAEDIDTEYFIVNGLNFEWRQISDEQSGDKYILKYKYKVQKSDNQFTEHSIEVSTYTTIETEEDGTIKVYYYKPYVVGYYYEISISVYRVGIMSSNVVYMIKPGSDPAINESYLFDLFASGDGINNPYVIASSEHLINVKHFNDKKYILNSNISLIDIHGVVVDTFSGNFDGNGKTITNYTLTNVEKYNLGIFGQVNDALFEDLTITYAKTIINKAFDGNAIYGGILAGKATNTSFNNIYISNSVIDTNITDNTPSTASNMDRRFLFGGIAGYTNNCSIQNCNVNMGYVGDDSDYCDIKITGWNSDTIYFGAVVGYAEDTNIYGTNEMHSQINLYYNTTSIISQGHETYPIYYVGGIAGFYTSSNANYIQYVNVNTNHSECLGLVKYNGGAIGSFNKGRMENIIVTGSIGGGFNARQQAFIGKLVATFGQNDVYFNNNNCDEITLNYAESDYWVINNTIAISN